MGILIGMDEAGYGPNLGPLVVAATAWEVAEGAGSQESGVRAGDAVGRVEGDGTSTAVVASRTVGSWSTSGELDLYRRLRGILAKSSSERRIAVADSKVLYKPGQGLRQLERGVHSVLLSMRQTFSSWTEIVDGCAADPQGHHRCLCWHEGYNCRLPVDAAGDELARLGARLVRACESAGVRPLAIRARLVFPAEFNELIDYYGNKAAALSHVTIGLLREMMELARETVSPVAGVGSPIFAICDKHGGRNFYTALLQHHFSEHWIQPVYESHVESRYKWGTDAEQVRVTFRMNGEQFMPTALASMTAKYLRELSMRAFNEFWCGRVPKLRPTAGYYVDSSRFKREIDSTQRELGIEDRVLWRNR